MAVLEAVEGAVIATLGADCTVLVLEEAAADWLRVAFATERGVVTGCVAAEGLRVLDADEAAAYLDALIANEVVTPYEGDFNRLMETVACAFADAEAETVTEAPEADAGEAATDGEETVADGTPDAAENAIEATDEVTENTVSDAEPDGEDVPAVEGEEANAEDSASDETGTEAAGDAADETKAADAEDAADENKPEAAEDAVDETKAETAESVTDETKPETTDEAAAATDAAEGRLTEAAEAAQTDAGTAETAQTDTGSVAAEAEATQDNAAATDATAEKVAAEAVFQLNMTQCTLGYKETYRGLSATGGSGTVTWSSSNSKIVRVDAGTGVIKGMKKGSATVTATRGGATASVKVTVKNAPKKIKFKPKKLSVGAGSAPVQLNLRMTKGAASAGTVYASSNEAVATVDANGMLTARSAGTAVITAMTYNHKKATCKVSVFASPAPSAIALPATFSLGVKESRGALPLTMVSDTGEQNCSAPVTWKSTNKKVVKVDPNTGAIYAVRKGTATIVAKTSNGLKAKCRVKVKKAPKKVSLTPAKKTVAAGGTLQYTAKLPKGSAGGCAFASSNPGVATIDENGLAKAVGAGTATITVTTYNGRTATASLTVSGSGEEKKPDVKVPEAMEKLGIASYQDAYSADLTNALKLEHVIYNAQNQLGKPYTYGGGYDGAADPAGFDCSGLVYWCFGKIGVKLKNSAHKQGYDNSYTKITSIDDLRRGDVVCFNTDQDTSNRNDLSDHTGIYLDKGYFIHASSSGKKVMISQFVSSTSDFYKRNFSWGRRILE
ncbi:MAG: Ig-like domain-containing protein [Clostridia bacterium]|nr:Ig-like domain-containing protein [Clostridia bacterium]